MNKAILLLLAMVFINNGMDQSNLGVNSLEESDSTESTDILVVLPSYTLTIKMVSDATFRNLKNIIQKYTSIPTNEQLFYSTRVDQPLRSPTNFLSVDLPDETLMSEIVSSFNTSIFTVIQPVQPLSAELNKKIAHVISTNKKRLDSF